MNDLTYHSSPLKGREEQREWWEIFAGLGFELILLKGVKIRKITMKLFSPKSA
jgi:hypothetical protein